MPPECGRCGGAEWYIRKDGRRDCAMCARKRATAWERADPRRRLWYNAKQRALKAGVPFTITREDIHVPMLCPVFGTPLKVNEGGVPGPASPSLDRISPEKGYVPGNVAVISNRANSIKSDATSGDIALVSEWLKKMGH